MLAIARLPPWDIAIRLANAADLALPPWLLIAGAGELAVEAERTAGTEGVDAVTEAARVRSELPDSAALPDSDKAFLRANDASRAVCAIVISVLSEGPGMRDGNTATREAAETASHPAIDEFTPCIACAHTDTCNNGFNRR